MRPDIGRYLEGRMLETIQLIKTAYDLATGQGKDVAAWIDGVELVFGRKGEGEGSGFVRVHPSEVTITLSFPRGTEIPDPQNRARGVPGSRTKMLIRHAGDLDVYVRRMIDTAYAIDNE